MLLQGHRLFNLGRQSGFAYAQKGNPSATNGSVKLPGLPLPAALNGAIGMPNR
jgi:hypothetical protein